MSNFYVQWQDYSGWSLGQPKPEIHRKDFDTEDQAKAWKKEQLDLIGSDFISTLMRTVYRKRVNRHPIASETFPVHPRGSGRLTR